jgi:hypothetical protein
VTIGQLPPQPWVSDEVWASLDPFAGGPSGRAVRRFWIVIAISFVIVIAGGVLWQLGLVVPRINVAGGASGISARRGSDRLEITLSLQNNGSRSVRIAGLTSSEDLQVVSVRGLPKRLAAHATSALITVRVHITDCKAARDELSLGVHVDGLWAHRTTPVDLGSPGGIVRVACA